MVLLVSQLIQVFLGQIHTFVSERKIVKSKIQQLVKDAGAAGAVKDTVRAAVEIAKAEVASHSPPMNHATLLAHADAHPMLSLENHVLPPNHKKLACPAFE